MRRLGLTQVLAEDQALPLPALRFSPHLEEVELPNGRRLGQEDRARSGRRAGASLQLPSQELPGLSLFSKCRAASVPWCGKGLRNFAGISRAGKVVPAAHPESDARGQEQSQPQVPPLITPPRGPQGLTLQSMPLRPVRSA